MNKLKFLLFFSLLSACLRGNYEQVRIVDKDGKPAKITKVVPRFNEEQMVKQKEAFNDTQNVNNVNKFRQNYNEYNKGTRPLNNESNINFNSDDALLLQRNVKYPNDIFDDRITNYNYSQNSQNILNNSKSDLTQNSSPRNAPKVEQNIENSSTAIIFGDVTSEEKNKKIIKKENNVSEKNTTSKNNYYIQIGVYSEQKNAEAAYNKYKTISIGSIDKHETKGKTKYKVVLGPYDNRKTAEANLEKVIKTGHYDVYITEKK